MWRREQLSFARCNNEHLQHSDSIDRSSRALSRLLFTHPNDAMHYCFPSEKYLAVSNSVFRLKTLFSL